MPPLVRTESRRTESRRTSTVIHANSNQEVEQNQNQNQVRIQNQAQNLQRPISQMQQQQDTRKAAIIAGTEKRVAELRAKAAEWMSDFTGILTELGQIEAKIVKKQNEVDNADADKDTSLADWDMSDLKTELDVKIAHLKLIISELSSSETEVNKSQFEMTRQLMKLEGKDTAEWEDQAQIASLTKHQHFMETLLETNGCSKYFVVNKENKESTDQQISDLKTKIARRKVMRENAEIIAQNAEAYMETRPHEAWDDMRYDNLKSLCIGFANEIWGNDKNRQITLSEQYIVDHMAQNLLIFDIFDQLRLKSKDKRLPEREQPELREAEQILSYYKHHVETVLSGYGMSLSSPKYQPQKIEEILNGKGLTARTKKWNRDLKLYEALQSSEDKKKENAASDWQIIEKDSLSTLERKVGATGKKKEEENDHVEEVENGNQLLDNQKLKTDSVLRLNGNIMNLSVNREREYIKAKRLYNVSLRFIDKLKKEGVWKDESEFRKISELCAANMEMYKSKDAFLKKDYIKEDQGCQQKVMDSLKKIMLESEYIQEKQYASVFANYFLEEQDGELIEHLSNGEREHLTTDEDFSDMNKIMVDKNGKKYLDRFESVEDQPLFEHKPTLRDISQGHLGDCFFLSTLSNIVSKNPDAIRNMMKDNHNGTVTVRFCNPGGDPEVLYATVEKTIPKRTYMDGKGEKVDPYSRGALWVKMMEKAYATVRESIGENLSLNKQEITYKDIDGGSMASAMSHLMGLKAENHRLANQERQEIGVFKGRLPDCCIHRLGKTVINSPSLIYYQKRHQMDKKNTAFRYLAGEGVSTQQKTAYKKELSKYKLIESMLEQILNDQEGAQELGTMDSAAFGSASASALESLARMLDTFVLNYKGITYLARDFAKGGVPQNLCKRMARCWKLCNKDASEIKKIASEMMEAFNIKLSYKKVTSEYTPAEEAFARDIQHVLDKGGYVGFGTLNELKDSSGERGTAGEKSSKGMYGQHAYTVLRIEKYEIGGRTKMFLRMSNPHGVGVPVYHVVNEKVLKRAAFSPENKKEKKYGEATHGEFLLELRDARSIMDIWVSGEKR